MSNGEEITIWLIFQQQFKKNKNKQTQLKQEHNVHAPFH